MSGRSSIRRRQNLIRRFKFFAVIPREVEESLAVGFVGSTVVATALWAVSGAQRRGYGSRPAHIRAGAGVDLDRFAFFDEERNVDRFSGFEHGWFCHVARSIATHPFR